jgi:predicted RNA-binding Zn-ribbon protein involved in translation (DUF1610 family)
MSSKIKGKCWQCGADLEDVDYAREGSCPSCGKPTHVCRNCRWYAPSKPNQCAEPVAEPVVEKLRANFCGYFEPTQAIASKVAAQPDEALRKAAEDLFKF